MRVNTHVLAIELKLCLVVATTQPDFMNSQKAADVQQGGKTPVARPERELQSGIGVPEFGRPLEAVHNSRKER
jgi:hypothetical protein